MSKGQAILGLVFAVVVVGSCDDVNQTSETSCQASTPTYRATSSSSEIWNFVDYVEVCQPYGSVKDNFTKVRAALEELVRRKDPRAMFELGLQLEYSGPASGETENDRHDRALGLRLQAEAKRLGYRQPPTQK